MAVIPHVKYTHAATKTFDFFGKGTKITWANPGKTVEARQKDSGTAGAMNDGQDVDPNMGSRTITCNTKVQGYHASEDSLNELNGYILPQTVPTYSATFPILRVYLDGTNYWDVLVMILSATATHIVDNQWMVTATFQERTA